MATGVVGTGRGGVRAGGGAGGGFTVIGGMVMVSGGTPGGVPGPAGCGDAGAAPEGGAGAAPGAGAGVAGAVL